MKRKELFLERDLSTLRRHEKTGGNVTITKDWIYSIKACTRRRVPSKEPMEVVIPAKKLRGKINEIRKVGLTVVCHEPAAESCGFSKDLWQVWNTGYGNQEVVSLSRFKELFNPAKKHRIEKFSDFKVMYSESIPDQTLFGLAYDAETDTVVLFE